MGEPGEPCSCAHGCAGGRRDLHGLGSMASRISATMLVDLCNSYAALVVVGHLYDATTFAGVAVGNMVFNICLLSASYGLAAGLDTLLSQAHGAWARQPLERRREQPHPGRVHVFWTVLLLVAAGVPLASLCIFSAAILAAIGQPAALVGVAGRFAAVLTASAGAALVCRTVQGKVMIGLSTGDAAICWPSLSTPIESCCLRRERCSKLTVSSMVLT
eukprot:SAG22_NODE_1761_length_3632_cov_33.614492_5_plen_217_part_00